MKRLVVIVGPNAVGKSTVAKKMVEQYENTAYVDSDWCRVMNPFAFTQATKQAVSENIYCLLRNYLLCEDISTVIFTYSWHGARKEIYENVIEKLRRNNIEFQECIIVLKCTREENIRRAINDGRDKERIERGMIATHSFYDDLDYPSIDTTYMTPVSVADNIMKIYDSARGVN